MVEPAWSILELPLTCRFFCEPSVAIQANGDTLVRSDGGLAFAGNGLASFSPRSPPPVPLAAAPGSFQNDGIVQAGPDGRFYFCALITLYEPTTRSLLLDGIQVASSTDGGATWDRDAFLSVATTPTHAALGADRQWLTFGKPGELYLSYQQIPAVFSNDPALRGREPAPPGALRMAFSSDGGRTFGDFVEASGEEGFHILGAGAVDAGGRLYVPYNARTGTVVAFSDDHGATFRRAQPSTAAADFFPHLAVLADGTVVAAWKDAQGQVSTAASHDRGEHWDPPAAWGRNATGSPWLVPHPVGFAVAWLEARGDGQFQVQAAWPGHAPTRTANLTAPDTARAYTDYVSAAALPGGGLAVVYGDTGAGRALLAVLRSGPTLPEAE